MKRKYLPLALCLLAFQPAARAQVPGLYKSTIEWTDNPVLHKTPERFKDASAIYLFDNRIYDYRMEGKNLLQYVTVHKLIKVANDKGIEMFNKTYIPFNTNAKIRNLKARVITSTGKVIDVPDSKIKDDEIEGRLYKLFAMEGLDKGSEIEYTYEMKKDPTFFGSEIFQSKEVPYLQATINIVTPRHLKFEAKGFNGFIMLKDSTHNDERILCGYTQNVPELGDEKYGLREPYLQRADFKFSYNLSSNPDVEVYTWKELSRNIYNNLGNVSDKEKKAVNKFIASMNIPEGANEETTIRLVEDFCKNRINIDEKLVSEDADNLESVIKTANTNFFGICRLFIAIFENKGIKYQVVFPSVRDQLPLDEDLENWNRIDETLFYFPSTGKFIQPVAAALRYPYVEPFWAGTRGLFLKGTTVGDVKTAIGKFDTIPMLPFDQHAHNMEIAVKMDASGDSVIIKSKQVLTGYGATSYRPIWAYLPKDKQDETIKGIIQSVAKSENITDIKVENTALTDAWDNKPLIISGTIHSSEPIEKAGNKILFKIGELIGTQEQMYQEKPRQLPAEMQYPHVLYRKISFEVPAGYRVKNLADLKMDISEERDKVVTLGFVSSYKMSGNTLQVEIMETYRDLKYPLSEFETFKKVINAAADFNKIVLVLEKQ